MTARRRSHKRRFGDGLDVRGWEFGRDGTRSLAIRGRFSLNPDSGPSAALRILAASCRFPVFAFGVVAGGMSRRRGGRCARCRPVVRWLQHTVLFEVVEDGRRKIFEIRRNDSIRMSCNRCGQDMHIARIGKRHAQRHGVASFLRHFPVRNRLPHEIGPAIKSADEIRRISLEVSVDHIGFWQFYKTASSPLRWISVSSFNEGPLGFFSPISHFCTVERLALRTAAKTA